MTMPLVSISARQTFDDNMRPAVLLLRVYRLLDSNDTVLYDGELVNQLRDVAGASVDEDLMLIVNEVFLGLVRERAQLPRSTLRQVTLCHLLRQAVVASCTALETFLPALLRENLPTIIKARGRDFMPAQDKVVKDYFHGLRFSIDETLRLIEAENAAEQISDKIYGYVNFKYLSGKKGVNVVGAVLGIPNPAQEIAFRLNRDERELMSTLDSTIYRRNDIVHRADRAQKRPGGEAQEISFAWTQHAVDTVQHVCLALDELVTVRIGEMRTLSGT